METHSKSIGIIWLRALLPLMVVLWHMRVIPKFMPIQTIFISDIDLGTLINFNFLLIAVPLFILVSLFLFIQKNRDILYLKDRIKKLLILYLFWTIFFSIFTYGIDGIPRFINSIPYLILSIIRANNTIYYFFLDLALCTFIIYRISQLQSIYVNLFFLFSCVIILIMAIASIEYNIPYLGAYYNPINFLPYIFLAIIIKRRNLINKLQITPIYIILFLLGTFFSILEWKYLRSEIFWKVNNYNFIPYTRISLVFYTCFIFLLFVRNIKKTNQVVNYLAENSLIIYLLHPVVLLVISKFYNYEEVPGSKILIGLLTILLCPIFNNIFFKKVFNTKLLN